MLADHPVYPAIPTADVPRLRRFYEDVLGFPIRLDTPTTVYLQAGSGTFFALTRSAGTASGTHTQMAFIVTDVEAEVAGLRARGVAFESATRRRRRPTGSPTWASAGRPGSGTPTAT